MRRLAAAAFGSRGQARTKLRSVSTLPCERFQRSRQAGVWLSAGAADRAMAVRIGAIASAPVESGRVTAGVRSRSLSPRAGSAAP